MKVKKMSIAEAVKALKQAERNGDTSSIYVRQLQARVAKHRRVA